MLVMFPLPSRILHYTPLRNVAVRVAQDEGIISPRYANDYVDCKSAPQPPSRHILQGRVLALLLNSSCRSRMPKVPAGIVSAGYVAVQLGGRVVLVQAVSLVVPTVTTVYSVGTHWSLEGVNMAERVIGGHLPEAVPQRSHLQKIVESVREW